MATVGIAGIQLGKELLLQQSHECYNRYMIGKSKCKKDMPRSYMNTQKPK
jgi:hypothetical protein